MLTFKISSAILLAVTFIVIDNASAQSDLRWVLDGPPIEVDDGMSRSPYMDRPVLAPKAQKQLDPRQKSLGNWEI